MFAESKGQRADSTSKPTMFFEISTETRNQRRSRDKSRVGRKVPSDDRRSEANESASQISETHLVNLVRFIPRATAQSLSGV